MQSQLPLGAQSAHHMTLPLTLPITASLHSGCKSALHGASPAGKTQAEELRGGREVHCWSGVSFQMQSASLQDFQFPKLSLLGRRQASPGRSPQAVAVQSMFVRPQPLRGQHLASGQERLEFSHKDVMSSPDRKPLSWVGGQLSTPAKTAMTFSFHLYHSALPLPAGSRNKPCHRQNHPGAGPWLESRTERGQGGDPAQGLGCLTGTTSLQIPRQGMRLATAHITVSKAGLSAEQEDVDTDTHTP